MEEVFYGSTGILASAAGVANNVAFWSGPNSVAPSESGGGTINWSGNVIAITKAGANTVQSVTGLNLIGSGTARIAIATTINLGTTANGSLYGVWGVGGCTSYNAIATVGSGLSPIYAQINLTAQSAALAGTALYTAPNAASPSGEGMYEVSWSATVTTAATTSSVLGGANGFRLTFTDLDANISITPLANPTASGSGNTIGTQLSGTVKINVKRNTAITVSFDYTSVGATPMQYAIHVRLRYLG